MEPASPIPPWVQRPEECRWFYGDERPVSVIPEVARVPEGPIRCCFKEISSAPRRPSLTSHPSPPRSSKRSCGPSAPCGRMARSGRTRWCGRRAWADARGSAICPRFSASSAAMRTRTSLWAGAARVSTSCSPTRPRRTASASPMARRHPSAMPRSSMPSSAATPRPGS